MMATRNTTGVFVLLLAGIVSAFGQQASKDPVSIEGATFVVLGDSVIISYDLLGPPDLNYEVGVVLRRETDTTFLFIPRSLTGNVGTVKGSGQKVIIWDYRKDNADTLGFADDYWFEITATGIEEGLGISWWHVALVGGGAAAAAILLSGGLDDTVPATELPDPPGIRPPR